MSKLLTQFFHWVTEPPRHGHTALWDNSPKTTWGHGGKSENKLGSWREVRGHAGVMAGSQRTSWGHCGKSENKLGSWRKSEDTLGS